MKTSRSESIGKIAVDLLKAQTEMGDAAKGSNNPFFKSKYADLNSVREAGIPVLNRNSISVWQPNVIVEGKQYIETVLLHTSGEFMSSLTEVITGKGTAQDAGSGISYARRYGLQSFLNIGAVDDDGEGTMNRNSKSQHNMNTLAPNPNNPQVTSTLHTSGLVQGTLSHLLGKTEVKSEPINIQGNPHIVEPLKKTSFSRKNKKTEAPLPAVFTQEELATTPQTDENW